MLDTYQPEREPNLRATIAMAIMMGRMVCTTSRWGAFVRDTRMRIGRALGKLPSGPPEYPPISAGAILAGSAEAGSYFPQAIAESSARLDDALGGTALLVTRDALTGQALAPFARKLGSWLDRNAAEAVLVRPDHYVFGTGTPETLRSAWLAATGIEPPSPLA